MGLINFTNYYKIIPELVSGSPTLFYLPHTCVTPQICNAGYKCAPAPISRIETLRDDEGQKE